jgi:hypothetical protein
MDQQCWSSNEQKYPMQRSTNYPPSASRAAAMGSVLSGRRGSRAGPHIVQLDPQSNIRARTIQQAA